MIIDGQWIDDEEWLEQQALLVYNAIQNVKAAVKSGDLPEYKQQVFDKYINYYATFRAPEDFWNSSSAIC